MRQGVSLQGEWFGTRFAFPKFPIMKVHFPPFFLEAHCTKKNVWKNKSHLPSEEPLPFSCSMQVTVLSMPVDWMLKLEIYVGMQFLSWRWWNNFALSLLQEWLSDPITSSANNFSIELNTQWACLAYYSADNGSLIQWADLRCHR